jgi:hypothetical protein
MAALQVLWTMLRRARRGLGRAVAALALLVGVLPALSRDPTIEAWELLGRRRRARPGRRTSGRRKPPRRFTPLGRGSVDDPHVRLRITM